jgi:transposase-like protein
VVLDIPRDRHGRFDPVLIGKYQRRFPGACHSSLTSSLLTPRSPWVRFA